MKFFNYAIFTANEFRFTIGNIILFAIILLLTKIFIKYSKRYFKSLELTEKQFTIEGREIAIWKLFKQIIWIIAFYLCFISLRISNDSVELEGILLIEFFRFKSFHIALYHIFYVGAVVICSRIIISLVKVYLLKRVSKIQHFDKGTEYIVVQLARYFIYFIAIVIIIRGFGIDMGLLLNGLAALLLGVGLGFQDIFKDFFAGFALLFESTVKVGDIIELQNLQDKDITVAVIREINLRTSKVETNDGKMLIIPNSKLTNETVNNWSFGDPQTRFMIPLTVHYGTDLEKVETIMLECAKRHPKLSITRPPIVRLLNFGDNGLELDLVFWAEQNFYIETLKSEIRFDINKEFQKAGIKIPYPQRSIRKVEDDNSENVSDSLDL